MTSSRPSAGVSGHTQRVRSDTVELIGKRNEETAELFGTGAAPAPNAQSAASTALASATPAPVEIHKTVPGPAADQSTTAEPIDLMTNAGLATVAGLTLAGSL